MNTRKYYKGVAFVLSSHGIKRYHERIDNNAAYNTILNEMIKAYIHRDPRFIMRRTISTNPFRPDVIRLVTVIDKPGRPFFNLVQIQHDKKYKRKLDNIPNINEFIRTTNVVAI